MVQTTIEYVQQTAEGSWRICNSRVSLDSIVHAWWDGQSPETIAEEFPTLSVEQVYGAIAFYLHNQEEMDRYLSEQSRKWEELRLNKQQNSLLNRIRDFKHSVKSHGNSK